MTGRLVLIERLRRGSACDYCGEAAAMLERFNDNATDAATAARRWADDRVPAFFDGMPVNTRQILDALEYAFVAGARFARGDP